MSTDNTIRPITPETPPVFPCWLWRVRFLEPNSEATESHWTRYPGKDGVTLPSRWFTHWHPDQPEAPTIRPDAQPAPVSEPTLAGRTAEQLGAPPATGGTQGETPRTDAAEAAERLEPCYPVHYVPANFARQLERELAEARAEAEAVRREWNEREPQLYAAERALEEARKENAELRIQAGFGMRPLTPTECETRLIEATQRLAAVTRERDGARIENNSMGQCIAHLKSELRDARTELASARKDAERIAQLRHFCEVRAQVNEDAANRSPDMASWSNGVAAGHREVLEYLAALRPPALPASPQ